MQIEIVRLEVLIALDLATFSLTLIATTSD
jgi:hypothetical protein